MCFALLNYCHLPISVQKLRMHRSILCVGDAVRRSRTQFTPVKYLFIYRNVLQRGFIKATVSSEHVEKMGTGAVALVGNPFRSFFLFSAGIIFVLSRRSTLEEKLSMSESFNCSVARF